MSKPQEPGLTGSEAASSASICPSASGSVSVKSPPQKFRSVAEARPLISPGSAAVPRPRAASAVSTYSRRGAAACAGTSPHALIVVAMLPSVRKAQ